MKLKLYRIEKGIKVPPKSQPTPSVQVSMAVATMTALAKGESFLIKDPFEAVKAEKRMRDLSARQRDNGGGREYAARKVGDGTRIWRTK